jgi:hypothetical protein
MCSETPLTPQEWVDATSSAANLEFKTTLSALLDLCPNLATVDEQSNVMRFPHLSAREYLEKNHFDTDKATLMAAESCLSSLIEHCGSSCSIDTTGFFNYSALHWACYTNQCCGAHGYGKVFSLLSNFLGSPDQPTAADSTWINAAQPLLGPFSAFSPQSNPNHNSDLD